MTWFDGFRTTAIATSETVIHVRTCGCEDECVAVGTDHRHFLPEEAPEATSAALLPFLEG